MQCGLSKQSPWQSLVVLVGLGCAYELVYELVQPLHTPKGFKLASATDTCLWQQQQPFHH
jgi:hypothetical protein